MQRFFSFFIGALIGGLIGATLAILLAPSSGEELRTDLRERASHLTEDVKQAARERRQELEKQLASLRSTQMPQ